VAEIVTDKLTAKEVKTDRLCIGETCVTEAELKEMLQKNSKTQDPNIEIQETISTISVIPNTTTTIPTTTIQIAEEKQLEIATTTSISTSTADNLQPATDRKPDTGDQSQATSNVDKATKTEETKIN
jgi:hypothetical protein